MAWLAVFFLVPMVYLGETSLKQGLFPIFTFQWAWGNFHTAISLYHTQFVRSFEYAGLATVIGILLAVVALGATACSGSRASASGGRYVDPLGWSLRYPRGMYLERSHASLRIDVSEVTVASFAM